MRALDRNARLVINYMGPPKSEKNRKMLAEAGDFISLQRRLDARGVHG